MWLEQLAQDLRYGCRTLLHTPAFAATTILTLAIGLALTTGVFTIFNAYVLRPFAVRDPGGLYQIAWHARDAFGRNLRWRDYQAIRDRRDLFTSAIAQSTRYVSSKGHPLAAELVSNDYFETLAPEMLLGRPLGPGDDSGNAVVLGYQAWAGLFARDAAAIGREIDLNGRTFVVVGVLGPGFAGLHAAPRDIWIPIAAYVALAAPDLLNDEWRGIDVSVRLQPGVTPQQAQSAITPLVVDAAGRERQAWAEVRPQDKPTTLSLRLLSLLSPVFAAFALVLLAGCANVSSVMLARAVARQREIAVRLSLGASRGRIVRQLLTEGLVIAVLAALAALALTAAGLRAAMAIFFGTLPPALAAILRTAPLAIDHRVFLFALAAGGASTLAFALVPALQASRTGPIGAVGAHGSGGRRGARLRGALVAGQVATSLLLVVPALTLARNGVTMRGVDVGFDLAGVLSINVREGNSVELARRLAAVLESEPRVADFALTNGNPFFGPPRKVVLESQGARIVTPYQFVSPGYFATLRIPIARGRGFGIDEARSEARVAIVSGATARAFWPGQDPIGKAVRIASASPRPDDDFAGYSEVTVVGVSGDVISGMIVDGPEAGPHLPADRSGQPACDCAPRARTLAARSRARGVAGDPDARRVEPGSLRGGAARGRADAAGLSLHGGVVDRIAARRDRARVERLGAVRRADLHADAALQGDRDPDRAGRDRRGGRRPGDAADRVAGRRGRARRPGRRVRVPEDSGLAGAPARRVAVGRRRVRRRARPGHRRRGDRRLAARPPRGARRSGADAARGLLRPLTSTR